MMSLGRILMYSRRFATVPPVVPRSPSLHITEVNKDSPKTENGIAKAIAPESTTKEVQGFVDGAPAIAEKSAKHEYEIVATDRTNLWDQLYEMMKSQKFTTQDRGSIALLREMDNVLTVFVVRKSDNLLIGFTSMVDTATFLYGSVLVVRNGYRNSGLGMQTMKTIFGILRESLKQKPYIFRAVDSMLAKYCRAPMFVTPLYEMYSIQLNSREELMKLFPAPTTHEYSIVSVRDLTPRQFQQLIDYDKMVTGLARTTFLQNYYSLDFVEGVVMYNTQGKIKGMAGVVPTLQENLYKLNPIYAENKDDAATLVHAVTARIDDLRAKFVCHVRTESAGDWIIKKCKDENVKLNRVGTLVYSMMTNQPYKDPSRTEFIFAPTNSPAHFDG